MWLHGRRGVASGDNARLVVAYLVLKLLALPWLMWGVMHMLGIGGSQGLALLLLTAVPVCGTGLRCEHGSRLLRTGVLQRLFAVHALRRWARQRL
jgi:hypothetical protein